MGSETDDLSLKSLSREGSFFSLKSTSTTDPSAYVTAREDMSTASSSRTPSYSTLSGVELNFQDSSDSSVPLFQDNLIQAQSPGSMGSKDSLSTLTIGDKEDTISVSDHGRSSSISPCEDDYNGNDEDETESSSSQSELRFEVETKVSKICNEIAEAILPDTRKKSSINVVVSGFNTSSFTKSSNPTTLLVELRNLALSEGGLLSNTLRKKSWPILLGLSRNEVESFELMYKVNEKIPKEYSNVSQEIKNLVKLDVSRVLKRFPPGLSDPQQDHLQLHLTNLICAVLNQNPETHYYQGFHDICLTFLVVCISQSAPYLAYLCLNKVLEKCLQPFMEKTMESTNNIIHAVFAIIEAEDKELYEKIVIEAKCPAAFCLPWVLTWFSHTLPNENDIFRLYDFILGAMESTSPAYLIPVFISASLVLRNSSAIKNQTETDLATMHHALSQLPSKLESLEPWLRDSQNLMKRSRGKEPRLLARGLEIKDFQTQLWNDDTNNNRRRFRNAASNRGMVSTVGSFIFVKHRWYTVALIVMGTAYLIQSKYGNNSHNEEFDKYIPYSVKRFFRVFWENFEIPGLQI